MIRLTRTPCVAALLIAGTGCVVLAGCAASGERSKAPAGQADGIVEKQEPGTIDVTEIDDYRRIINLYISLGESFYFDRKTGKRITGLKIVPSSDGFSEGVSAGYDVTGEFREFVGYIDVRGRVVVKLPPGTIVHGAEPFSEGRALIWTVVNGQSALGIIDTHGRWVVKPSAENVDENLGECHDGRIAFGRNDRVGFLDRDGRIVIPVIYHGTQYSIHAYGSRFRDGFCLVWTGDDGRFIDTNGVALPLPDGVEPAGEFHEGFAAVETRGTAVDQPTRYGFIDRAGKLVIPSQFTDVGEFVEGLCPATLETDVMSLLPHDPERWHTWNFKQEGAARAWGFIDKTGRFVIKPQLDRVGHFSEGLAQFSDKGKIGYINRTGKIVIPAQFLLAWDFDGGVAQVVVPGGELGVYAWIDRTGRIIINTGVERMPEF